jgi:cytochrome oxidase Cu insertion factor (SCO1/SenC/PrrC family)
MLRFPAIWRRLNSRKFCNQVTRRPEETPLSQADASAAVGESISLTNQRVKKAGRIHSPNFEFTISHAILVVASGFAILGMVKLGDIAMEKRKNASQLAVVSEEQIGKPKLGGSWTLYDCKTARPVTTDDLKGKYQLVYFGFTYCPDICPEEMQKQATVVDHVDKALKGTGLEGCVQPIFITVDPRRDTLAQTRMYVKEFHPRLLGLTGSPEQIKKVTRKFRVYYNEGIRTSTADGEEDYLVDHSIIHYFMGPDNQLVDFYGKNLTADEISKKILNEIHKANAQQTEKKVKRMANNGVSDA